MQTGKIKIGNIDQSKPTVNDQIKNIDLFNGIKKYINKQIVTTTKLKQLQEMDFTYEPTARFQKQMEMQRKAIIAVVVVGLFTFFATMYTIVNKKEVEINLKDSAVLEKVITELKESNIHHKKNAELNEKTRLEIIELKKQIEKTSKNQKTNNEKLVNKLVEAIKEKSE